MKFERDVILGTLRSNIEVGKPIIGAGAGTGISAKCTAQIAEFKKIRIYIDLTR